jgi:(p)ppGpp synthase/HD superfamily hydrolase
MNSNMEDEKKFMMDKAIGWNESTQKEKFFFKRAYEMRLQNRGPLYMEYIDGILDVMKIELEDSDLFKFTIIALHDVLEDGKSFDRETLKAFFNHFIAKEIDLLTRKKDTSTESYLENLKSYEYGPTLIKIKLASKLYCLRRFKQILWENQNESMEFIKEIKAYYLPLAKEVNKILYEKIKRELYEMDQ